MDESHNWPADLAPGHVDYRQVNGGVGTDRPDYATQLPGASFTPGNSGRQPPERVRIRLLDLVFENWMPFTAWLWNRFIGPQAPVQAWESPISFYGAGENITRQGDFPSGERPYPYPYMIGAVSGFMPMLDQYSMAWAWGKTPSGPGVLTPIPIPWDAQYPSLPKVSG